MKKTAVLRNIMVLTVSILCATTMHIQAHEAGEWIVRVGAATVAPNDDSSEVELNGNSVVAGGGGKVKVDNDTQMGLTIGYMFNQHWGVELLAATPFKHDISSNQRLNKTLGTLGTTSDDIGSTKQLPPTLMAQYYFPIANTGFTPYVGLGVNYTIFFDEDASRDWENGAVGKSKLDLENSWGLAAQMGMDYNINDKWLVNAAVWYIDIDTEATLTTQLGKVKTDVQIDPWVYMVGVGYKF